MSKRLVLITALSLLVSTAMARGATHTVQVGDSFFSPKELTIEAGDTVTWTNQGTLPHNVVADDRSFRCAEGCDETGGNGTPSAAAWSVSLTFDDPGSNPYYCELHGARGGIGMAGTIIVEPSESGPGDAHVVWVPIAGSVRGAGGSFFRTDSRIFNPSETKTISIGGTFLPIDRDNGDEGIQQIISIGPRQTLSRENVVETLFGGSGLGALRFQSDDPFDLTARIFTDAVCSTPPCGTYGQFVSGMEGMELTAGTILNLTWTEASRSNVGFANPNPIAVQVTVRLFGASDVQQAEATIDLQPMGSIPPQALRDLFALPNLDEPTAWILFEAPQPVIGYGSMVDNRTNDQIFIPARPLR